MSAKYTLTEEHRAQLAPWAERWIRAAMSTAAMSEDDRAACRVAVRGLYEAAGLVPPPDHRIVFVASPFVLRFAAGWAAWIWYCRRRSAATRAATSAATYAATRDATYAATDAATSAATYAATDDATYAATYAATDAATSAATYAATDDATYAATYAATDAATSAATYAATDDATYAATRAATWYRLSAPRMPSAAWVCVSLAYRMWAGGNQWSGWVAFLSFFRHVAKLPIDYSKWQHWETLAERSGPRVLHADFAMISDRPEVLTVDAQRRPHSDTGPFCRWRDGSALYAVHGVRVPWDVIERPESITVARIEAEQNAEVRRVMVERYGLPRYIRDSGAERLHSDECGTLWRKEQPDDEPIVTVEVLNSTPEPDGSVRTYFLRCHPELRPMLGGERLGEAQAMTARNAVASTFGLRGSQYRPQRET